MVRLKFLRNVLGKNQSEMGHLLGISQNTYCNYENGKRKLSLNAINNVSLIGISSDWLLTGTINKNHHAAIIAAQQNCQLFDNKPISVEFLAERLGVPEPFIQAIIDGDISPSQEFYDRMMHDGFGVDGPNDYHDRREAEIKKIFDRQAEQPREQVLVDEIEDLKEKLDAAYEMISKLKEEAAQQKGRAEAYREMAHKNNLSD